MVLYASCILGQWMIQQEALEKAGGTIVVPKSADSGVDCFIVKDSEGGSWDICKLIRSHDWWCKEFLTVFRMTAVVLG